MLASLAGEPPSSGKSDLWGNLKGGMLSAARGTAFTLKNFSPRTQVLNRMPSKNPVVLKAKRKRKQARRRSKVKALRQACKIACIDCGATEKLQFDHVRGIKRINVASIRHTATALLAEIALCEVRCSPCHHTRHKKLRSL